MKAQEFLWAHDFGKEYTDRNVYDILNTDLHYLQNYGVTRSAVYSEIINNLISHNSKILEVGCNTGRQLMLLQSLGFNNLYGVDIQNYAIEVGRKIYSGINLSCASIFDLPFQDGEFDLAFTNGVLIHIKPSDLPAAVKEIYRVTRKYILCWEYYSEKPISIHYRGYDDLLWKTDFAELYLSTFPDLVEIKSKQITQLTDSNMIDEIVLLSK